MHAAEPPEKEMNDLRSRMRLVPDLANGRDRGRANLNRPFSFISANWGGRPLTSLVAIVNVIAATRTKTGLRVRAEIDKGRYPKGVKVAPDEMEKVRIQRHDFHGDWNYTIRPRRRR